MNLTGKTVVVYGAGVSGISAAQLVRDMGGRAVIYDDNPKKSHSTSNTAVFRDCDIVVTSPGVRPDCEILLEARLAGKQVIGELEFASLFCAAEQIAVTGTNGKTTAVMLIDRILRAARIPSHAVGNTGAAFSAVVVLLNILYVLFQDLYIFPRTFSNYAEYKKSTPFLIPSRGSILRCRDSWRGAGRG